MGVRGLQTFLKNNSQLSYQIEVSDTTVVIDANNLLCFLYIDMCQNPNSNQYGCAVYGGDMVTYGERVKQFFNNLDKCSITPILIFDGSTIGKKSTQNQLVLKEKTIYQRGLDKFMTAKTMSEDYQGDNIIMTTNTTHIFKTIVTDLGIQRIQTPYDADGHIARVARDLNCVVLTNDSDFIIYPLPQGFIMLDSFCYTDLGQRNGKMFVRATAYTQEKLMRCLSGLRRENLPLLSVLLGNDYIDSSVFERFVESICNQNYFGPFNARTWAHKKIASLLIWAKNKSLTEAIDYILDQVNASSAERLRQNIRILLRNYKIEQTDNFEAELSDIFNVPVEPTPASYLRTLFERYSLNPIALDIVFHNTNYNYPLVDDLQLPSSSLVKYRPYSVALALLRPRDYQGLTTYRRKIELERDAFYIHDRLREEYSKLIIRPLEVLEGFGSLEHISIYTMMNLEPMLKKTLLMATFRFNADEMNLMSTTLAQIFSKDFVHEATICLLLIKYIGLETRMSPKPQFVESVLLTMFFYASLNGDLNGSSIKDSQLGHILISLRSHSIKNNGIHYESSPSLYRRILHFISQLQAAYISYCLLNTILNYVFQELRYEKFFNGTLIFRLTKLLRLGELKVATLCKDLPLLKDICGSVKVMVHCDEP